MVFRNQNEEREKEREKTHITFDFNELCGNEEEKWFSINLTIG